MTRHEFLKTLVAMMIGGFSSAFADSTKQTLGEIVRNVLLLSVLVTFHLIGMTLSKSLMVMTPYLCKVSKSLLSS